MNKESIFRQLEQRIAGRALTAEALGPDRKTVLRHLLARAGLVTISREADWVRLLKLEPLLTPDSLLAAFRPFAEATIP